MAVRRSRRKQHPAARAGTTWGKGRPTPRRGEPSQPSLPPRPRLLGYWLHRPEPSAAIAFAVSAVTTVFAFAEPAFLIVAVPVAVLGVFVWRTRDVWRDNAENWRARRTP